MKYILLSRHKYGHGIHSPFVFDLVTRVFRNKIDCDVVSSIEKVRRRMQKDRRYITVTDMGSGSKVFRDNYRRVSDIARYSPVPERYGVLLSNIAKEFGEPFILELGTSLGISTMYMASSCPDSKIITIEGCPELSKIALSNFKDAGMDNISILTGSFDEALPAVIRNNINPGLVFIDGNHRKNSLMKYFSMVAEIAGNRTVIIIDDIHYSAEMEDAWNQIKLFEKVTATIDIFRMGVVFFKKGISNNNYIIRY